MAGKLLVFDSHPVQYRAPVWQTIEAIEPGAIKVIYATDITVKGHVDVGFGKTFAWDEPMLEGYSSTILNCEKGAPLSGWASLTGKGVKELIRNAKPQAILLTGLNYKYDLVAYFQALLNGIPVWLRCETQDQATYRSRSKTLARWLIYRLAYIGISKFFYIGELNKQHYLKHGVPLRKLTPAYYGTVNRFEKLSEEQKFQLRAKARKNAGLSAEGFVIGFSGKFIPKKQPDILFNMLDHLPAQLVEKVNLYFIGSGTLEPLLLELADKALKQYGVKTYFAGFVNQSQLAEHYLAMDIMILPSRRMNETWGLVANEAMQAGCGVIVSDAVGCSGNFAGWERFRIFKEAAPDDLANKVRELAAYPRSFDWADELLMPYSITSTSGAIHTELNNSRTAS